MPRLARQVLACHFANAGKFFVNRHNPAHALQSPHMAANVYDVFVVLRSSETKSSSRVGSVSDGAQTIMVPLAGLEPAHLSIPHFEWGET